MNNLIIILFISSITLVSCNRKDVDSVGPELAMASSNFMVLDSFEFNSANSNFQVAPNYNYFNATFNERVTWEIKISGTQSKAYKIIKGTSEKIDQTNSIWWGTHTNPYFFLLGETVVAELSVWGTDKKWGVDSSVIIKEIRNYGPDALIWWDFKPLGGTTGGLGLTGTTGWYSYFADEAVDSVVTFRPLEPSEIIDPVQGPYRSLAGVNLTGKNAWWAGFGQSVPLSNTSNKGFPGASLDEVYLNFYIRRRTPQTPSMSIQVQSVSGRQLKDSVYNAFTGTYTYVYTYTYTTLQSTVLFSGSSSAGGSELLNVPKGYVKIPEGGAEGWQLISIKLSQMEPTEPGKPPFDPGKIISITGTLGQASSTGFDMDFIVFTRGVPFNMIKQ